MMMMKYDRDNKKEEEEEEDVSCYTIFKSEMNRLKRNMAASCNTSGEALYQFHDAGHDSL